MPIDITKENLQLLEKQMKTGIGASLPDTGPGAQTGTNWPPLSPKYLGNAPRLSTWGAASTCRPG